MGYTGQEGRRGKREEGLLSALTEKTGSKAPFGKLTGSTAAAIAMNCPGRQTRDFCH